MATTSEQIRPITEFGAAWTQCVIDTVAQPVADIDLGATNLRTVHCAISTGADFVALYDSDDVTPGTTDEDYVFPTQDGLDITFVGGVDFTNLSVAAANAAGMTGDPSNANTITLTTVPA